ncbi:Integrase/recombinase xerD [Mycena sanguinolenta]|uniref:Integrase/recombinase xerD n=1 Tax=Mycena sanguinolenta TaxID=230812 RepID=A0A8H7CNW4_9AGAR|nr:Integrase/recombinase xerD [Mycena sanguinolenta]
MAVLGPHARSQRGSLRALFVDLTASHSDASLSFFLDESDTPATSFISTSSCPPRSIPSPAPSLLLSNESAANRFFDIPHSVLFPPFCLPCLRSNTDFCANSAPPPPILYTHRPSQPHCTAMRGSLVCDYPDRSFVDSLLHIIDHGCNIGFTGDRDIPQTCTNLRSAFEHSEAVTDTIVAPLSAGRLAGPYTEVPFPSARISPLGVAIRRKRSGKLRQIHHLSWPHGRSVNDGIPDSKTGIVYDMLARSIDDLRSSDSGSLMIKFDLEAAFPRIPIRHANLSLLGLVYLELFLMFGLRSTPYFFNLFALDLATPHSFVATDKKTECRSTCLEMLGIELDSVVMEARFPVDKLSYLSDILQLSQAKTHCSLHELQEFTGYLIFCSQVIPHSRAFLQSLFDFATSFKSPYSRISRRYLTHDIKFKGLFAVVHAILCWGPQLHLQCSSFGNFLSSVLDSTLPSLHSGFEARIILSLMLHPVSNFLGSSASHHIFHRNPAEKHSAFLFMPAPTHLCPVLPEADRIVAHIAVGENGFDTCFADDALLDQRWNDFYVSLAAGLRWEALRRYKTHHQVPPS